MNFIKDFIMEIGRKLKNVLSTLCVIVLLLMLLTGLGTLVFKRGNVTSVETKSSQPVIVEDRELDREVKGAMDIAREAAYEYASTELDIWINEMMARADEDFLDDYFSFMQTKRRELTSLYNKSPQYSYKLLYSSITAFACISKRYGVTPSIGFTEP